MNTEQLSKREYWADRAPEVPEWFNSTTPEGRPLVIKKDLSILENAGVDESFIINISKYYDLKTETWDNCIEANSASPIMKNAIELYIKNRKAANLRDWEISVWDKENTGEAARLFQWKWFYADQMMKQSGTDTNSVAEYKKGLLEMMEHDRNTQFELIDIGGIPETKENHFLRKGYKAAIELVASYMPKQQYQNKP